MMSSFDLEKMVGITDNLSFWLDVILCCKDTEGGKEILEYCKQLDNLIISLDDQMNILKETLIKAKNVRQTSFKRELEELKTIEDRCNHMIANFPLNDCHSNEFEPEQLNQPYELKEYKGNNLNNMTNISVSPVPKWNDTYYPTETTMSNGTSMSTTMMEQTLKSQAVKHVANVPVLKSVDKNEMDTVSQYMKGRLTELNVNVVIDSINTAFENKYHILRKPRNALKKKDQDMYNTWKIQQNSVGKSQYFVTADDITKFSETKMDKITLNIITILRHLKRLKESRIGSSVYYLPH